MVIFYLEKESKDMKDLLNQWMLLKQQENEVKNKRVELEDKLVQVFDKGTTHFEGYIVKITNKDKYTIVGAVPEDVDIMTAKVDDNKVKKYAKLGVDWIEVSQYKPTFSVVKEEV